MRYRLQLNAILVWVLMAGLVAGCGGGGSRSNTGSSHSTESNQVRGLASPTASSSPSAASAAQTRQPNVNIIVKGPSPLTPVSSRYSCDGGDISLPLRWGELPTNTAEIDLFIYNYVPIHEKLVPVWAVAGLKPTLRGIGAGEIPRDAVVGRNRFGQARYSLCPPKGRSVLYEVLLYAVPRRLPVKPGFDAEALTNRLQGLAKSEGSLQFSYKRR
jgi:phosphatidylethanolamine-binding protein (PEBP) family uncharacterized protein